MQKKLTLALLASSALAAPVVERRQLGGLSGLPVAGSLPDLPVDSLDGLPVVGGLAGDMPAGVLDHHQTQQADVDPIVDHDVVTEDPSEVAADEMFNAAFKEATLAAASGSTSQSTKDFQGAVTGVQATAPKTANSGPLNNNPLGSLGGLGGGLGGLRRRQLGGLQGGDGIPQPPAFALENLVSTLLNAVTTLLPDNDGEEGGPIGGPVGDQDPADLGEAPVKRQLDNAGGLGFEGLLTAVLDILTGFAPEDDTADPYDPTTPVGGPVAKPALRTPASDAATDRTLMLPGNGTTAPMTIVVPATKANHIVQRDDGEDDAASLDDLTSILGGLKRRDDGGDDSAGLGDLTSTRGLKKRSIDDAGLASLTSLLGEVGTLDKRSAHANKTTGIPGLVASLTSGHKKNSTTKAHKTAAKSINKRQHGDDDFSVDFDEDKNEGKGMGKGMGKHPDHPEAPAFALEGLLSTVLDSAADLLPGVGGKDDDDSDNDDEDVHAAHIVPAAAAPVAAENAVPAPEAATEAAPVTEASAPLADAAPELDSTPLDGAGLGGPEDQSAADALPL